MKIIILISVLLLSSCSSMVKNANTFTASGLVSGSIMEKQSCNQYEKDNTAVWVVVDKKGECVRYFSSDLNNKQNKQVVLFFHGDRIKVSKGISRPGSKNRKSPEIISQDVEYHSTKSIPMIYVSRPGVYGSSGDHKQRRRPREVKIMRAAVNKIIDKYYIKNVILTGQSGGGHIVASLLPVINNASCAVITSGVTAVRQRVSLRGWDVDITGYNDYYDPIKHVSEINNKNLTVYIVGDLLDSNVPFATQKSFYNELVKHGIKAKLIQEYGKGRQNHGLKHIAKDPFLYCSKST